VLDFEKNDDHLVNHLVLCSNKLIAFIITEHVSTFWTSQSNIFYFPLCFVLFCSILFSRLCM